MDYKIALIPGDGIGPEIVREAKKVLDKVCEKYGHSFSYSEVLLGGASIDVHGVPLTDEAIATAKSSDAVLMGSIGGDAKTSPWYKLEPSKRPEAGLLAIRKALNLFANLRPAYLYNELRKACPLRDEIIGDGFDMIIVRELTGAFSVSVPKMPSVCTCKNTCSIFTAVPVHPLDNSGRMTLSSSVSVIFFPPEGEFSSSFS